MGTPQREAAVSPVPSPPPDPGDLGGCSSLEAQLAAKRQAALDAYSALQTAAAAVKDFKVSCETILQSPIPLPGSTACQEYMNAMSDYNSKLSEFNSLYKDFIGAANAFNAQYPICEQVACPNGQTPNNQLASLQINPGIPDPTEAINQSINCKSSIESAITDINNRIKEKQDCITSIGSIGAIFPPTGKIPDDKGPIWEPNEPPTAGWGPVEGNPNIGLQNMLNAFLASALQGIQSCSGKDLGYNLGKGATYIPVATPKFSSNPATYNREVIEFMRKVVGPALAAFVEALKNDISVLNTFKDCLTNALSEADAAIDSLSPSNYEQQANNLIKQIGALIDKFFKFETVSASISATVANQPSNANGITVNINDNPGKLDGLVSIDRSQNPPIGTVSTGKALQLLEEELGEKASCPPKRGDKGKWTLPISVSATVKQYIKPEDKKAFAEAIKQINEIQIGKKTDCSGISEGKCPTSVGGISINFDPNSVPDGVTSGATACKGAPS